MAACAMQLSIPKFQFRFVPALGNVIHPGNFHPVGTQQGARALIERARPSATPTPGGGGNWLVIGGSGGFGSAARVVLGIARGANTLDVSFDGQPNAESSNKIRKIGSPGFHRSLAIEKELRARGVVARSLPGDAFDPAHRAKVIAEIREHFAGKLDGIVWALAAPRAIDPRTASAVTSALRPLGGAITIKTMAGRDGEQGPKVSTLELTPGSPEEAIATIFVMGGQVVSAWVEALREAELLAPGFTLVTISYRGNPLNEGTYRKGLIGLAKADLEFHTRAIDHQLKRDLGGRAVAVEGPAVVTEASGGIPGVPFYMAHLLDVMGGRFEDPLASMQRMFAEHFGEAGPTVDAEGLLRMDDRELALDVQAELARRFEASIPGEPFPAAHYDRFMTEYARTRGFEIDGVDYDAEFDTDDVCR
jgi:enoyl-[acyl-carrier protein] reductase / trans-2-enoyl-CoA reductase (NAD+)